MNIIQACSDASRLLYRELSIRQELHGIVTFERHVGDYYIQVYFVNPLKFSNVSGISISYPPNRNENQKPERGETFIPETIELTLIQSSENMCYNEKIGYSDDCTIQSSKYVCYDEEIGYSDICRYYFGNIIVKEIIRISQFINDKKHDDNDEYYEE